MLKYHFVLMSNFCWCEDLMSLLSVSFLMRVKPSEFVVMLWKTKKKHKRSNKMCSRILKQHRPIYQRPKSLTVYCSFKTPWRYFYFYWIWVIYWSCWQESSVLTRLSWGRKNICQTLWTSVSWQVQHVLLARLRTVCQLDRSRLFNLTF